MSVTVLKGSEDLNKIIADAGIAGIDNIPIETLLCVVGVGVGIVYLITAILSFKATKPGAKTTVLLVISFILLFFTILSNVNAGFNWRYFLATLPDLLVIASVLSLKRNSK